ncbi:MAG TPA: DUF4012 domain-containing protein [Mycobacteriales bacterium]|jgi:hypothetical protein|nr:DUF4012 domain-containing protein [Mycobacteriales bacterium]
MRKLAGAGGVALLASLLLAPSAAAKQSPPPSFNPAGAVVSSRVNPGGCARLLGAGFAPSERVVVSDNGVPVRSDTASTRGTVDEAVCFGGAQRPGAHELQVASAPSAARHHAISSLVYLAGPRASADATDAHAGLADHVRRQSELSMAAVAAVPLLLLLASFLLLVRAARRARARRRVAREAAESDLLLDPRAGVRTDVERRRSTALAVVTGATFVVALVVVYGASRGVHLIDHVDAATAAVSQATTDAHDGRMGRATQEAQRAVREASAAQRDQRDVAVRLLAQLPGLTDVADSASRLSDATELVARSVTVPSDQVQPPAHDQLTAVQQISPTGWGRLDRARGRLSADLYLLATQVPSSELSALRSPMLKNGRRYLLLVQDDTRSRATGGLVVATAVLAVRTNTLVLEQVAPADATWGSVNLTPDFPTVAAGASAAWRQRTGQRVDGVVAIDDVALQRLGAPKPLDPVASVRAAFAKLHAGVGDTARLEAELVAAAAGGHVQVWSAHPGEERLLAAVPVGGALPAHSLAFVDVVTQGISDRPIDGQVTRRIDEVWRATGQRANVGSGPQPMADATLTLRVTNAAGQGQLTWLTAYFNAGTGVVAAQVDGKPVAVHTAAEKGSAAVGLVLDLRPHATVTVTLRLVQPLPGGQAPVYVQQPRIAPDSVAIRSL